MKMKVELIDLELRTPTVHLYILNKAPFPFTFTPRPIES